MTDTRDALMRAILVDPADDTPRLVYADWLEENGAVARAEFVRMQCELARRRAKNEGYRLALVDRERELWAAHSREWFVDESNGMSVALDDFKGPAGTLLGIVRRGFVSAVHTTLASWVGGPCGCENGGVDTGGVTPWGAPISIRCEECNATGRTPALGPRIVAEQPVGEVEVSGKRPLVVNNPAEWSAPTARWAMSRDGQDMGFHLVKDIFELLPTGPTCVLIRDAGESWNSMFSVRDYVDESAAQSALSLALVNWARREAGLPPLEERR